MSKNHSTLNIMGVLALELSANSPPQQAALSPEQAGKLAQLLGKDLVALIPQAQNLDLSLMAAHFDPAEVLRPKWPLHQRLDELTRRAPAQADLPRLIALGADVEGNIPLPLQADSQLQGGQLRVLPFVLHGDADIATVVGDYLETELLHKGMAQADTALFLQETFGAKMEHVRYLTLFDLAAMMAMQYENTGLGTLWPIIEAALLTPEQEEWIDSPPEPLLRYFQNEVHLGLFTFTAWQQHYQLAIKEEEKLQRYYEFFLARQRQWAAVLGAHGIDVIYQHCPENAPAREGFYS